MATMVDCADPVTLLPGMREARAAIARGDLVVMPTDTVYGIAADAFQPAAVQALLDAKGRGRQAPPPVLVPNRSTLDALAEEVPDAVVRLADAFWPGALTIVLPARTTLIWDLGETGGTVALRMPDDRIALELLAETGPLAVSSANLTGRPAATTAQDALEMLGDAVDVYLDGGATPGAAPSTIVDATGLVDGSGPLLVLREGAIAREALEAVVPEAFAARPEAEPDAADGEPDAADGEPEAADGEPDRADGEPDRADGEPDRADAEPDGAQAEPYTADAEPDHADLEPDDARTDPHRRRSKPEASEVDAAGAPSVTDPSPGSAHAEPAPADAPDRRPADDPGAG